MLRRSFLRIPSGVEESSLPADLEDPLVKQVVFGCVLCGIPFLNSCLLLFGVAYPKPRVTCHIGDDYGKIVNERHVDRLENLVKTAGGTVVCGGTQAGRHLKHKFPQLI